MAVTFYPNYIHNVGFTASAEPSFPQSPAPDYTSSGGETSGAGYDLVDSKRDNVVTFDTSGESDDFTIDFDLTANITDADFCIIDNANLAGAFAAYKISHGGTDLTPTAWAGVLGDGTEAFDTISISSDYTSGDEYVAADDCLLLLFSSTSNNNWELNIQDFEASSYTADVTIGEISIGKKFTTSYQPEIGLIKSSHFGTNVLQSKGGQKYGFKNYGEARKWQLNWIYISDAEKVKFETLWGITEGQRYPFYIDLGNYSDPQLYFVRFAQPELKFTEVPGAWKLSIVIEEEI